MCVQKAAAYRHNIKIITKTIFITAEMNAKQGVIIISFLYNGKKNNT
jgi:hypothetical protein